MERDIALIHSKKYSSMEIVNLIKKSGKPLLEKVELIGLEKVKHYYLLEQIKLVMMELN